MDPDALEHLMGLTAAADEHLRAYEETRAAALGLLGGQILPPSPAPPEAAPMKPAGGTGAPPAGGGGTNLEAVRRVRELAALDLGERPKDHLGGCESSPGERRRVHYPTLYISGKNKKVLNLPRSGKAVIRYRVKSRSERSDTIDGDRYTSDVEVRSIEPVKKAGKLKALSARVDEQLHEFVRPRDPEGRYSEGESAPTPEDMAVVTQRDRKKRRKAAAAGAGAAAAVGAAALPVTRRGVAKLGNGAVRAIRSISDKD